MGQKSVPVSRRLYEPVSHVAPPPSAMAPPFHVSEPGSPAAGTVQNRHACRPVRDVIRGQEAANAVVAAGHTGDDEIADDERRHRAAVGHRSILRQEHLPHQTHRSGD